jgi:1A family penicillin-binding protein
MPKSKKHYQSKKTRSDFYEAVPMTFTPPAALPGAHEQVEETLEALARLSRNFAGRRFHLNMSLSSAPRLGLSLVKGLWRAIIVLLLSLKWIGLTTTNWLMYSGGAALRVARQAGGATIAYTPPIASDLSSTTRSIARAFIGRRARAIYLVLLGVTTVSLAVVGAVTATQTVNAYAKAISSPAALLANKKTGVTILDRTGKVLFEGYGGQDTKVETLSDLPKTLTDATLAAEDPTFYSHAGVSLKAIARAAIVDATQGGAFEGGSTITQQLVKNALLNSNKDLQRKYEEVVLATELEHRYSKSEILDMYLNEIYYGQGSSGVEAASETYFHTPARDLTLGESALIAGLPLGPSRFDPNLDTSAATGRRNYVLGRMLELGDITNAQANTAEAQPIQLASVGAPQTAPSGSNPMVVYSKTVNIQAPWFVFYVLDQLRAQYGDDLVEQGGITVTTTLDLKLEDEAENDISAQINNLQSHHVTNGALISLEPKTGDIIAMVGSANYNAPGFGNVNVILSQRQPGSSFKPIAYATAFKKGWTGATTVLDAPVSFPQDNGTTYTPQNYDLKFHGVVTLRHALDNSLNIPAIKVLEYASIPATLQTAHDMGITTLNDPSQYGLSLVLGGGDVMPIDMATVYATLDNGGVKVEPRSILKVTDREGQNITKNTQPAPQQVLDPRIAYMLTNIMADNVARLPEFPLNGPLELDRPAAAKTGTTDDFRDNWTIGYTPQIVTAVWAGNNDNSPMQDVDGITGAAPIWHNFMEQVSAGTPVEDFVPPAGITFANVCGSNGGLTGSGYQEVFMTDQMPTLQCDNPAATSPADTGSTINPAPADTPEPTAEPAPGSDPGIDNGNPIFP